MYLLAVEILINYLNNLLGVIDLPINVIFEMLLPAFCERFSDFDEIEENQFNITSYEIGLA